MRRHLQSLPGSEPLLLARICPRPLCSAASRGDAGARVPICAGPLSAERRSFATPLGQRLVQVVVCGRCGHEWLLPSAAQAA